MSKLTIKGTSILYDDMPFTNPFTIKGEYSMNFFIEGMEYPDKKEGGRFRFTDAETGSTFFEIHMIPERVLALVFYDKNNIPLLFDYDIFPSNNNDKIKEKELLDYLYSGKIVNDDNITFLKNFKERDEYIPKDDSEDAFIFHMEHMAGRLQISLYPSEKHEEYPYVITVPTHYYDCRIVGFAFSEKERGEDYLIATPDSIFTKSITAEDAYCEDSHQTAIRELHEKICNVPEIAEIIRAKEKKQLILK